MERPRSTQITILSDNVHLFPTTDLRGTHVPSGECSASVSERRSFGPLRAARQHILHISPYDNWVGIRGQVISEGPRIFKVFESVNLSTDEIPVKHCGQIGWTTCVGRNPYLSAIVNFGRPDPLVRVEFLGNPDQMVARLMSRPETGVFECELPFDYVDTAVGRNVYQRSVIACGGVQQVIVSDTMDDGHIVTYEARGLALVEVKEQKQQLPKGEKTIPSAARLSIATIANNDGLLRIHNGQWHTTRKLDKQQARVLSMCLAEGLALADQTTNVNPESLLRTIDLEIYGASEDASTDIVSNNLARALRKRVFAMPRNRNRQIKT